MQTPEAMNNLAMKAQKGDQEALLQLWQGVSRLAYKLAMRYKDIAQLNGAVDLDDLKQCAFLGFFDAVNRYDPDRGAFSTYMCILVRRHCREALGLTGRERREHYLTISMETPFAEDLTIADTIPDPDAADALYQTELRADVEEALHRLPENIRELIRLHDLRGLTMAEAAELQGCTVIAARNRRREGLRRMRKDRRILDYDRAVRLRYKGFRAFQSDWMSVVEAEAIRHLDKVE